MVQHTTSMAKIKMITSTRGVSEGTEQWECFYTFGRNVNCNL